MPKTACKVRLDTGPCSGISQGCHVSGIAGFSRWLLCLGRDVSLQSGRCGKPAIAESVKKFHARSRQVYGYRKVHEDLIQEEGHSCSAELVRRVMRKNGLKSKVKSKFVVTTDSAHAYVVAPNRLARDFSASTQNQKWVGDITYIRTHGRLVVSVHCAGPVFSSNRWLGNVRYHRQCPCLCTH